jgi:glycosyltransferase involved in cell wall biosynthesis
MACGTPVIAVNEGGYIETVEDGNNGILITRSVSDLAEAMMKIASDKDFAHTLSRNALIRAKNFSWENHIDAIEKYLEMLLT